MTRPRVCFFAKVKNRDELERVEFYAQDLRVLDDLGFDVHIATTPHALRPASLYFVWWWTWAFMPIAYAAVQGRPAIITGVFDYWKFNHRPIAHRWLHRYALHSAAANVFISELEYRQVPSALRVNNPHYIPLAVDLAFYRPKGKRTVDVVFTTALMTGGNGKRKCIGEVIQAAALILRARPELRFIIAGRVDPIYPEMAAVLGIGNSVEFPGEISQAQKIEYMQRCAIYLQPTHHEGFGLAICEAMACGAPVITSLVGAVPEVVGSAARFVDGSFPDKIAEAVLALLDQPNELANLSRQGPERISRLFSYERHRQEWANLIDAVMRRPPR